MPIIKYTTTVEAVKTAGEIQGILAAHGATAILMEYEEGRVIALAFRLKTPNGEAAFRLPIDAHALLRILERDGVPAKYRTHEQAVRVGWRIVKDWVASQAALVETSMVKMEEVFMPYLLVSEKQTLFERWQGGQLQLGLGKG